MNVTLTEADEKYHCASAKKEGGHVKWKSKECDVDRKNYICQYNKYCPAGYGGEQCVICDIGTYKDSIGNGQCSSCESTKTTTHKGSDNVKDCGESVSRFLKTTCCEYKFRTNIINNQQRIQNVGKCKLINVKSVSTFDQHFLAYFVVSH